MLAKSPPKAPETLASYWTPRSSDRSGSRASTSRARRASPRRCGRCCAPACACGSSGPARSGPRASRPARRRARGACAICAATASRARGSTSTTLRRTGRHRRLVKTGLKTRAHGDLTLILPLNVDTRRIESLPRAATGADHQPPDAAPDGHAPRNGVRADAEVARDGPARRRRQRLGRIVVGHSPAWGQTTRTEDPGTGSKNRVREPPRHPRGGHRRTPPRSLETPVDQIQGVPARARSFRPGVTEVAPTPMGRAHVPGL